jgi:hypothetical protein
MVAPRAAARPRLRGQHILIATGRGRGNRGRPPDGEVVVDSTGALDFVRPERLG